MGQHFSILLLYLTICYQQVALAQDEEEAHNCPKLSTRSLKVVCEEKGKTVNCSDVKPGAVAKAGWKKNAIKGAGKVKAALKCHPSGQWKFTGQVGGRGAGGVPVEGAYGMVEGIGVVKRNLVGLPYPLAEATCQRDGGVVFSVDSDERLEFVTAHYKKHRPRFEHTNDQEDIWTGVTNLKNKNEFKSTRGIPGESTPMFGSRQKRLDTENNCLVMNLGTQNLWQIECKESRPFFCEIMSQGAT